MRKLTNHMMISNFFVVPKLNYCDKLEKQGTHGTEDIHRWNANFISWSIQNYVH